MTVDSQFSPSEKKSVVTRILQRTVDVKADEVQALLWSCVYFFCVMSAYYVIRPIRDEMGVAAGVENLPWLFTGTLAGMIVLNPPFSALVTNLPRVRFVSITYRFFMANLFIFYLLLQSTTGATNIWVGRVFYIWTAVFNLFVVSVFWGFMADTFTSGQGRRLFGFIGAGGTLGGILGSGITATLVGRLGPTHLLVGSMMLLEIAVQSMGRLSRLSERSGDHRWATRTEEPVGGKVLAGLTHVWQSPYLLAICAYMFLFTILSTFLYFEQANIVARSFTHRAARTALFAKIDLWVNILTLSTQVFLTHRIVKALGVAITLTLVPILTVIGFGALGFLPALSVVVVFQVLRRSGNFAVARPTREMLFTVIPRENKYKAKSFIDTFVYRLGDQVGAWTSGLMGFIGLSVAGFAFVAVPISAVWVMCGLWLGRKQEALAARPSIEDQGLGA
ncbi:MAG: hypothetical protein LUO89_04265 [Methanothrix sp.]|nr:hypothetical protein [Methanothrix sp.]